MLLLPGPVIDADHAQRSCLSNGAAFGMPKQRVVAHRHPQSIHQPFSRAPASAMTHHVHHLVKPYGSAAMRHRHAGQPLGEDLPRTRSIAPAPAVELHSEGYRNPLNRQVFECPAIAAVAGSRNRAALRTLGWQHGFSNGEKYAARTVQSRGPAEGRLC